MQTGFSLDCVTLFRLFLPMKVYSLRLLTPTYHDSVIFSRSSFLMVFGKFLVARTCLFVVPVFFHSFSQWFSGFVCKNHVFDAWKIFFLSVSCPTFTDIYNIVKREGKVEWGIENSKTTELWCYEFIKELYKEFHIKIL